MTVRVRFPKTSAVDETTERLKQGVSRNSKTTHLRTQIVSTEIPRTITQKRINHKKGVLDKRDEGKSLTYQHTDDSAF